MYLSIQHETRLVIIHKFLSRTKRENDFNFRFQKIINYDVEKKTFVSSFCCIVQRRVNIEHTTTRNCLKQWMENDSEAHDEFASETQNKTKSTHLSQN